jgi:methionine-rich copper-binding protein CopC
MRKLLPAAVLAGLALLATAAPAAAHTELESSNPADGAQLAAPPTQLTLTFSEPVSTQGATVTVTGPNGNPWQVGTITAQNSTLTVPVQPAGPAGQYTLAWKITSADGDPASGTVRFALTAPAVVTTPPATTTPPPTTTTAPANPSTVAQAQQTGSGDDGGIPAWYGSSAPSP